MKKGQYILVETKTLNDSFGTVLYRVDEVGLDTPDGGKDGLRLVMQGGTGSLARNGLVVRDTERVIGKLVAEKKAKFLDDNKAQAYAGKFNTKEVTKVNSGGIIELG
jgi:hypothetical protein